MKHLNIRIITTACALVAGLANVGLMWMFIPIESIWAEFLVDREGAFGIFSVQNIMWLIFFIGC